MKAKIKNTHPIEYSISIEETDFDKVKQWLNKAIGFVDYNGLVNSSYSLELTIKETLNPKETKMEGQ